MFGIQCILNRVPGKFMFALLQIYIKKNKMHKMCKEFTQWEWVIAHTPKLIEMSMLCAFWINETKSCAKNHYNSVVKSPSYTSVHHI